MKRLILTAALAAFALPATADPAKVIQGCEVKQAENGNYFNKVDPTCVFRSDIVSTGTGSILGDLDHDPATPDTYSPDGRG